MLNTIYTAGVGYSESQVMGMTEQGQGQIHTKPAGFPKKCFKNPHDKCLSLKNSLQQKGIPVTI